jgi:hypothetical protein
MDQIVRLLVDAARVAAGSFELFPDQTDVVRRRDRDRGAPRARPRTSPVVWSGDPGRTSWMLRVWKTTLLSFEEALAWWAGEGATTIGAERQGGNLHAWASRAGATIDTAGAEALFVPRKPGSGAGSKIGLYVARAIAETQGGRAWAQVDGATLSFHLELPLPR